MRFSGGCQPLITSIAGIIEPPFKKKKRKKKSRERNIVSCNNIDCAVVIYGSRSSFGDVDTDCAEQRANLSSARALQRRHCTTSSSSIVIVAIATTTIIIIFLSFHSLSVPIIDSIAITTITSIFKIRITVE